MIDKVQKIGGFSLIQSGNLDCIKAPDGMLLLERSSNNTGFRATPTKIIAMVGQTKDSPNYVVSVLNENPLIAPSMPRLSRIFNALERFITLTGHKKIKLGDSLQDFSAIFALAGKPVPPIRKSMGLRLQELLYQ